MIPVNLFDDGGADLGPLSDLRGNFDQRTGALTARERWQLLGRLGTCVRAAGTQPPDAGDAIWLNSRFDLTAAELDALAPGALLTATNGTVIARRGGAGKAPGASGTSNTSTASSASSATAWSRPWHLLDGSAFAQRLERDMDLIVSSWKPGQHGTVPSWATKAGGKAVHVHATATIGANAVLDASNGSILLDEGCKLGHCAVITGPAYIGRKSTVAEHALIKANTSIGPHCRAGGEIGSAIFQGYSNKTHDGHLGDALVGEWVNLGAGTTNSNLLNTYAEVAMRLRPGSQLERTGRQFMGCIIGDHVKLAICTRIMTGTSIGTGTMWAATAPVSGAVENFRWVTDGPERAFQRDKFMQVARTVMARRSVEVSAEYEAALIRLMERAQATQPALHTPPTQPVRGGAA